MDLRWNLDALYKSFECEAFIEDMEKCSIVIDDLKEWTKGHLNDKERPGAKIEDYIHRMNNFFQLFTRLYSYGELTLSVDAKNEKALQAVEKLEEKIAEITEPQVNFQKWLGSLEYLDKIIGSSKILGDHDFYLMEIANKNKYLLSEKEEVLIAKMKNTGSNGWSKLQELVASTLLVDIEIDGEEKQLPLSVIRNMAYDKDMSVRKNAYEAELKAYNKIEQSSAAALNAIKGEVITLCKMRGYGSVLEKTLIDSRLDKKALDAMLSAIKESLPALRRFYRHKASLLGHNDGLPFYDLFAPVGDIHMKFTFDEARDFIVRHFGSFSDTLGTYGNYAFQKKWIDAEPREGKRGGAFCANLHTIKESRILSNFTGTFNDVITLAHELGHGYHGECLMEETYLNSQYPMPIAETASIFCETIIKKAAINRATKEEAFGILERELSDAGQVIVDIYSRFLFESELFERREEGSLSVNELKEMMIKAQKEAYGEGLDHNHLHPYMWICKPHYYYGEENFYNFPYAFGLLFAKGLYGEYLKRGESFVKEYDDLLSATGKNTIADVAKRMDIDIGDVNFWRSSLKLIEEDIEKFISI